MKLRDTAQAEYAVFPDRLQRITKSDLLPLRKGVAGIEDDGRSGPEQSTGHAFSIITFQELIGHPWPYDPVYPARKDGGRHPSPVGMDYYYPISQGDLLTVLLDYGIKERSLWNLLRRKDRVKKFLVEVMKCDLVTVLPQR